MKLAKLDAATLVRQDPLLERSHLLQALGEAAEAVLARAGLRRYPGGATIYGEHSSPDRIYLLARGEVVLLSSGGADATPLVTLHPGDCFGTGAALEPPARAVTVRAVGTADLVEIPAEPLRELARNDPTFSSFLQQCHERLKGAKSELDDFLDRW
ncbi:MAG: cyclic nucleotide-binding domain-containing protein [Deltaproteobacteria bacterium]|nr:cyclic nucleotide-binding domain-containing protein [Deltaproteobacteria bacterium]